MNDPRDLIVEKIQWILGEMGITGVEPEVSLISELKFGDFATNLAMVISKKVNESPRELAGKIVVKLTESQDVNEVFEKIEIAGPGFINFYLSSNYLSKTLQEIVQGGLVKSQTNTESSQKIIVEFGDPNPFKEIHIGHLRNFCIGESFSRLLETQGKQVTRANYQGDVGLHVAKCLWGILQESGDRSLELGISVEDLSKGYVLGASKFEDGKNAKQEIVELNKKIYEVLGSPSTGSGQSDLQSLWSEGRKVSLAHFEEIYKRIGVKYDKYYYESETAKRGREIVLQNLENGVFERHEGAVVYRGEQDGLHTRVFLTAQDYATYEGKDLALALMKYEDNYDESYILTGSEQAEYFQVMLAALKKIDPGVSNITKHFTFGHVRLKEGKMSSRTGDVITASWLLDEAVKRVHEQFPEMDPDTSEKVGVGAVKYSMLKFGIASDIHFDFDDSISMEGNSGPYLQYTYVRTQSVLQKFSGPAATHPHPTTSLDDVSLGRSTGAPRSASPENHEENDLLRFLTQYPYHLEIAATSFAPNLLCNYLFELAQKFNLFYQKHKIIGSDNESFRLSLTQAVGLTLKHGLSALGIETVEKM